MVKKRKRKKKRADVLMVAPSMAKEAKAPSPKAAKRLLFGGVGIALLYAVILSAFSLVQHLNLRTQMADLGNADQSIWAVSQGDLSMTISGDDTGVLRSRFGIHANVLFILIGLLYIFYSHAGILLVLTSVASASAGLGIFFIARHSLPKDSPWTLVPLAAFLFNPMVHDANLYDFHIITITTALLVWALFGFRARHPRVAWICLGLAMLCKEDVPLIVAVMGVYLILTKRRRDGVIAIGASIAYLLILFGVVMPFVEEGRAIGSAAASFGRHRWLGASFGEMVGTIFTRPLYVLKEVLAPYHLRLPVYLLLLGGLAGLRAWRVLLPTLPFLGIAMISNTPWMTRITGTYYWMPAVAFISVAVVFSARRAFAESRRPWQLVYLGAATSIASFLFSPLPHGAFSDWANYSITPYREQMMAVAAEIPKDASLCAQNNLAPHFTQRKDISARGPRCEKAEYRLYHLRRVGGPDYGMFYRTADALYKGINKNAIAIQDLIRSDESEYGLLRQENRFYLFKRGAAPTIPKREAILQLQKDYDATVAEIKVLKRVSSWTEYLNGDWKENE